MVWGGHYRAARVSGRFFLIICASWIHELRACDNSFDQRSEAIAVGGQRGSHTLDGGLIGEQERPPERVCEQFSAEIVDEILLAMLAYVRLHANESGSLAAAGKNRLGIDRMAGEVLGPPLTDRSVAFERQAERIEARVTRGADRIF